MKIFTIDILTGFLDCSVRTAWRRLHQWNAYTSYNHNAKYHTLSTIPRFDKYGIWRHNDIYFSKYGNLTKTIVHLVDESQDGIEARRLCSILGVSARSLYTHFRGIKEIVPQRIGRTLFFFSSQIDVYSRQIAQRTSTISENQSQQPRSTDAVLILVDRIKHPDDSIEHSARRLQLQSPAITPEAIHALLAKFGIEKKTTASRL
jgi:hypothetical protein